MILQRTRIIVGDAGFEPRTSAPEIWCASNEPPHLPPHMFLITLSFLYLQVLLVFVLFSRLNLNPLYDLYLSITQQGIPSVQFYQLYFSTLLSLSPMYTVHF